MFRLFQWSNVKTPELKMGKKYLDLDIPTSTGTQLCLSVMQATTSLEQRQLPVKKTTPGILQHQLVRKVRFSVRLRFLLCVESALAKIEHRVPVISWMKAGEKVWNAGGKVWNLGENI